MVNLPIEDLEKEKIEIENKILELNTRLREINNQLTRYNAYGEIWIKKTISALSLYDQPLTTDEILRSIFYANPIEIENPVRRRNNIFKLSTILNRLCRKGELFSKKYGSFKGNLYFLKEWVTIEGREEGTCTFKVKAEYERKASDKVEKNIVNRQRFDYA